MIEKTAATVLRYAPSGETSRVVTWLTPQQGRVATLIKGALRPKSWFLGQYDLFYTCELLYYRRPDRKLFIAKECSPLKLRPTLRHDWLACGVASYWADLAARISPAQAPQRFLYRWLNEGLDELDRQGVGPGLVFWQELRLLKQLGLAPRLEDCAGCGATIRVPVGPFRFSIPRGGVLCASCARQDPQPAHPLPPDVLAMLRNWQRAADPMAARRIHCDIRQTTVIERILGEFLRYHLDLPLISRELALQRLTGE